MMKVCLQGASGRTGGLLLEVIDEFPEMKIAAALVSSSSKKLGSQASGSLTYTSLSQTTLNGINVAIDFSTPQSCVTLAQMCGSSQVPLLVATTGLTHEHLEKIQQCAKTTAILIAPNTSIGVFALKEISLHAQRLVGDNFDIEVSEIHHNLKKDAPSGTALYLARALAESPQRSLNYDRSTEHGARKNDIGVTSIRGGDVVGEHTVFFIGKGERIELTHRVWDRKIFARGALRLAQRLVGKSPGLYQLNSTFILP